MTEKKITNIKLLIPSDIAMNWFLADTANYNTAKEIADQVKFFIKSQAMTDYSSPDDVNAVAFNQMDLF